MHLFYIDWQEKHKIKDLSRAEAVKFFSAMLNWVKTNQPEGNYIMQDMDWLLAEIKDL